MPAALRKSSLLAGVASVGVAWLRAGSGDSGMAGPLGVEFLPSVPCPHWGMASDSNSLELCMLSAANRVAKHAIIQSPHNLSASWDFVPSSTCLQWARPTGHLSVPLMFPGNNTTHTVPGAVHVCNSQNSSKNHFM